MLCVKVFVFKNWDGQLGYTTTTDFENGVVVLKFFKNLGDLVKDVCKSWAPDFKIKPIICRYNLFIYGLNEKIK